MILFKIGNTAELLLWLASVITMKWHFLQEFENFSIWRDSHNAVVILTRIDIIIVSWKL